MAPRGVNGLACLAVCAVLGGCVDHSKLGFDRAALDKRAQPCDDFYEYACGSWVKRTSIPDYASSWERSFSEIGVRNASVWKQSLKSAAAKPANAEEKQLGDFYAACLDEHKAQKNSRTELDALLKPIDSVTDLPTLAKEVAHEHMGLGTPLFTLRAQQDFKDATLVIGALDQAGLGLPDRDYYINTDARSVALRKQYEAHIAKMFVLAGTAKDQAAHDALAVVKIETELAKASTPRAARRDPTKLYHRMGPEDLVAAVPQFPWTIYLEEMGIPTVTQINVVSLDFFTALGKQLVDTPIADWRAYLRWRVVHAAAPLLGRAFVDEQFHYFGKTLGGTKSVKPRWVRCAEMTGNLLSEEFARMFVQRTFGADSKAVTKDIIDHVEKALHERLAALAWMDDATRNAALDKLGAIKNKVGYPDAWRDYSSVKVTRDSYLGNVRRSLAFETKRQLAKIGRHLDRGEWDMSPAAVNAYYNPSLNEIVFPAAILQPPFYAQGSIPAVNYGAIGVIMGHELTHGFDDAGRKFDGKGNLVQWWSPATDAEFERRAQCVIDQYDGYEVIEGKRVNGRLTTGENIADLGGVELAYHAFVASRKPGDTTMHDGYSDEQLFFLGFAQSWCNKRRPELERELLLADPHSTPKYRVNGPLSNASEFAAAFQCKPGSKMVRSNACAIW